MRILSSLSTLVSLSALASGTTVRSPTPPMGWNSYNSYGCSISEQIIKSNAQGLVDLGFSAVGYKTVTTDCGWMTTTRDSQRRLQWNPTLFPSGGKGLGDFLHGLGLKFGLYSGGGYLQCGSTNLPASLNFETIDAQAFADWGGDSLKYDNCYATNNSTMVDNSSAEFANPARFQKMATALNNVNRDIAYYICQWGLGTNLGEWAGAIGNTWRISNDIYNSWRNIWRITNEVVPYYRQTRPGAFPDMDMLIVGLNALTLEEERFHFGMWAINKSPLKIGARVSTSTPAASLNIMKNQEVIAINQDSLAQQARLVRRYTVEEWDIWAGRLSGSRMVVGIANWKNAAQTVQVDLRAANVSSATARDVWAARDLGVISGTPSFTLAAHELKLLVLSGITSSSAPVSAGYNSVANAALSGATLTTCAAGDCLPVGRKAGNIGSGASVTFTSVRAATSGRKVVGVDFINYDIATDTAWGWGSNTRNMTISVNGGSAKRWAFPISGGDWSESGRLTIEADGFVGGTTNTVVFRNSGSEWAPDLVGFEVFG